MSLFGKKTYQENKYALPYGIVLATAFFLAMIVFSICYGNKEYMADVMGREFEKNIIGQTSFMAGGFALIFSFSTMVFLSPSIGKRNAA